MRKNYHVWHWAPPKRCLFKPGPAQKPLAKPNNTSRSSAGAIRPSRRVTTKCSGFSPRANSGSPRRSHFYCIAFSLPVHTDDERFGLRFRHHPGKRLEGSYPDRRVPSPMTSDLSEARKAFYEGSRGPNTPLIINNSVEVIGGKSAGLGGTVISLEKLEPELVYLIEPGNGSGDVLVVWKNLRLLEES